MDNHKGELNRWVDERMAALAPDGEYRPNVTEALAHFRRIGGRRSGQGPMWGWATGVATAMLFILVALPAPRAVAQRCINFCFAALAQGVPMPDRPVYAADNELVRPADYREWVYLSSGLGMEYNPAAGAPENFTNVFVAPWAYRAFLTTGKWPDKTMFALESRASQSKGSINKAGHFQGDLASMSVEVKDETRFAGKWAYFGFGKDRQTARAMTGPADACWQCHNDNAAVEHTFVQFYPTLKPVALKFGTYRAQAE